MNNPSPGKQRKQVVVLSAAVLLLAGGIAAFLYFNRKGEPQLPKPGDQRYEDYLTSFQLGTAYLDAGLSKQAEEHLTKAIETVPEEPAAWANRAIVYMREGNRVKEAAADLAKALALAPDNPEIEELAGFLAEIEGKFAKSKEHFQKASAATPDNSRRLYKTADLIAKLNDPGADQQRLELLERIVALEPGNLFALKEHANLAAQVNDRAALKRTLDKFDQLSKTWQEGARKQLAIVKKHFESGDRDLKGEVQSLGNTLAPEAGYAKSAEELSARGNGGTTLQSFIKLAQPPSTPAEPDLQLTFKAVDQSLIPEVKAGTWTGALPIWLNEQSRPIVYVYNAKEVRRADAAGPVLTFPAGAQRTAPSMHGVLPIDWKNEFRTGIVLAGAGGLRFHHQKVDNAGSTIVLPGVFEDVTEKTKLPAKVLSGDYYGAWAVDIDFDGDIDILLARRKGPPLLLRNNFDDTFAYQEIFPDVEDVRAFAWLDLDHDGAADAALLDGSGRLHVFMNQRSGVFTRRPAPDAQQKYIALAVADVNDDGVFDLIALTDGGSLVRISDRDKGKAWDVVELAKIQLRPEAALGAARLAAVDLDNNGAVDLVLRTAKGGTAWLADGKGGFQALAAEVPPGLAAIADLDENGAADLLGVDAQGHVIRHEVSSGKGYEWFDIKPRAEKMVQGDQRVNSYTLGSEIEIRTGALVIKQAVEQPTVHFGLGSRKNVNVIRAKWTNGADNYEFQQTSGATVTLSQRLKGSCPFLFAWNGKEVVFVADFCWSTPLGMYINAQDKGGFAQTTDWTKISGNQLAPKDGLYDLRVSANLWETHYLDELGLIVVDHPPGTEVHIDERFFLEPTKPQVYLTGPSRPIARALDHKGQDVTDIVRTLDGNYLDRGGRGVYQGVTNDHWVEVDLGDDAPSTGPVYLLAHGWVHPTDSSINFALEQNKTVKPMPLVLEIPDGKGGWKEGRGALGFPAGKNKTCVIRLDGIEGQGVVTRRFRLRTNLEIYWDALHYASGLDSNLCKQQRLPAQSADLAYRGIIRMSQASPSAPELPHYDDVIYRRQVWRDLIGYYTRFGDVRELIEKADDRFMIMNAGDELRLTYAAPEPPPTGWKRDFIWVCDGWVKDGDLNTRWGKTVLPLPYHGMKSYDSPPGRLEDDPVYRRFPEDWVKYHTRYVTPELYERGLRTFRRPGDHK